MGALSVLAGSLAGWSLIGAIAPAALAQAIRPNAAINPQQVPTARYARGESVDVSLIVEEWRDRYPDIPIFVCSCNAETCGDKAMWPYREFTQYQPFVALGPNNAARNQTTGFNCFDMETGEQPGELL